MENDIPEKRGQAQEGSAVVSRALDILQTISASERALALPELTALVDLPKATTHRLCQQLEATGYLMREPGGRRYAVGPRLLNMGLHVMRSGVTAERHAILQWLVDTIGETCNFTTLAGHEVLYLDRVELRWPLRLHFDTGSRVPAHCTASGKLFLSAMKPDERRRVLDALTLSAYTPFTITARADLETELTTIARQGYSLDRQEFLLGLIAIALPVTGTDGAVVGAVACHALSVRLDLDQAMEFLPQLREAARKLSATLAR